MANNDLLQAEIQPLAPAPDWTDWSRRAQIEIWQAVALSVNREPGGWRRKFGPRGEHFNALAFLLFGKEFSKALRITLSHIESPTSSLQVRGRLLDRRRSMVELPAFAAWAEQVVKLDGLPTELVAIAHRPKPLLIAAPDHLAMATESSDVSTVDASARNAAALPHWKMRIQAEATRLMLSLRKSGASPTVASILGKLVAWCQENDIKTDGGITPSAGYLKTHVLGGKHWKRPD